MHVSLVVGSHGWHSSPQVSKLVSFDWHELPEQQPPSHDAGVHTHCPLPLHAVPAAHAGPVPQPQVPPSSRHRLLELGLQATQLTPFCPHVPAAGVVQMPLTLPPWQQPLGHDVESQTQFPPLQRWPTAHCALLPQRHCPPAHWFERVVSHAMHAPPSMPHCA